MIRGGSSGSGSGVASQFVVFFILIFILCVYFWLYCVFVAVQVFSSCSEQGPVSSYGAWASHGSGFSCCRAWALGYTGFSSCSTWAQKFVAHELCCPAACGIFPDQGLNQYLLHWQVDSLPLSHQGNPHHVFICRKTQTQETDSAFCIWALLSYITVWANESLTASMSS